jgi:exopolysaccharide biosynthesis protein
MNKKQYRRLKEYIIKIKNTNMLLYTLSIITLLFIVFILVRLGSFTYRKIKEYNVDEYKTRIIVQEDTKKDQKGNLNEVIVHKTIETKINGLKQVINILEINPDNDIVKIRPALSHNALFGFENLSEMVKRHEAYAGINGGFFNEYGDPSGMVLVNGELITMSEGKYPVFFISDGVAKLKELEMELWLKAGGQKAKIKGLNGSGKRGAWLLYTRQYGTKNGIKEPNVSLIIKDNIILKIVESDGEVSIPKDSMVMTFIKTPGIILNRLIIKKDILEYQGEEEEKVILKIGDSVELVYEPNLGLEGQAYECGSWIIKKGEIVIGEKDPWIGVLTNRDPRTAIGIKEDGKIVLITVDGRQPGYSYGFTGRELGEFLLEYGVKDAAMLDGGASTEMIVDGKIINRPSFKGEERPLGGAILIEYIN